MSATDPRERVEQVIELDDRVSVELAGEHDRVLRALEERLDLDISLRGNLLTLAGLEPRVKAGAEVVDQLAGLVRGGHPIVPGTVETVADAVDGAEAVGPMLDDVVWRNGQLVVTPRTAGQKRYVDAVRSNTITLGIGPAGTGKTYLAVAIATAALMRREVARIILTRPAVEAGERLGFLPGDLAAKVDPYLRPLFDALYDMLEAERVEALFERGQIEVAPLAFMRGRSLNDSFIILDEAQNTTPEQMKMFLTRLGYGSRMIVNGDTTQIDLPAAQTSGLVSVIDVLEGVEDIAFVRLDRRDVVRHRLVQRIVDAYGAAEGRGVVIEIEARAAEGVDTAPLVERLTWVCGRLGVERASLGLMVVGPDEMAAINGEHRGKPTPTDVLAFPVDGPEALEWPDEGPPPELGDVVICPDLAQEPLETLAVHGLLHLLGYDHEVDAGEMLALQDRLVDEAP